MTQTLRAGVAAIVVANGSGELDATLTAISGQVYELVGTVVVGTDVDIESAESDSKPAAYPLLAEAIESLGPDAEFLWIVAEGAAPMPDALTAAVKEIEF